MEAAIVLMIGTSVVGGACQIHNMSGCGSPVGTFIHFHYGGLTAPKAINEAYTDWKLTKKAKLRKIDKDYDAQCRELAKKKKELRELKEEHEKARLRNKAQREKEKIERKRMVVEAQIAAEKNSRTAKMIREEEERKDKERIERNERACRLGRAFEEKRMRREEEERRIKEQEQKVSSPVLAFRQKQKEERKREEDAKKANAALEARRRSEGTNFGCEHMELPHVLVPEEGQSGDDANGVQRTLDSPPPSPRPVDSWPEYMKYVKGECERLGVSPDHFLAPSDSSTSSFSSSSGSGSSRTSDCSSDSGSESD